MYSSQTEIRVRYAETDQMQIVYYGNYATYFEVGRVESFRQLGISYRQLEEMGFLLPVVEFHCKYLRSAKYDELLTVKSTLAEMPEGYKMEFLQEIFNESGKLLTTARVLLFFVDAKKGKRTLLPEGLKEKLLPFFKEQKQKV